jgi:hypothetical protein
VLTQGCNEESKRSKPALVDAQVNKIELVEWVAAFLCACFISIEVRCERDVLFVPVTTAGHDALPSRVVAPDASTAALQYVHM